MKKDRRKSGKRKSENNRIRGFAKRLMSIMPALILIAMILMGGTDPVYANWHDVTLSPGQTYDCAKASKNTSVNITKPGDYYLKGKSRYVRVDVKSSGVNLHLMDGLHLNCGMYSYIGSRTSPITIGEKGGTVKLISQKNADIYLEGYMAPGIRKDGTKTELVFETEDPHEPGTIEAKGGNYGAGIGSVLHIGSEANPPCGHITINSGIIKATGTNDAAGIGGGPMTRAENIRINGGEVYAEGSKHGAGIGAGYYASASNIFITGGIVEAQTQNYSLQGAAAIGGGGGSEGGDAPMTGNNIYISGGDVTAISYGGGTAIGGGSESAGKNIVISGGRVHAEVRKASSGKQPGNTAAIGAGGGNNVASCSVKITGGEVYAKGGYASPGIGSKGTNKDHAHVNVTITGGTVVAEHGPHESIFPDYDIGGLDSDHINIRITGGSVFAEKICRPKDDDGRTVHRADISLDGLSEDGVRVTDAVFTNDASYGMDDVFTRNGGKIYPWLPGEVDASITRAKAGEEHYAGNILFSNSRGTLYRATHIKLTPLPDGYRSEEGYAYALIGDDSLTITDPPLPQKGYKLRNFTLSGNDGTEVADKDGKLKPDVGDLTDADGKWKSTSRDVEILARCEAIKYKVHFDSNKPRNASTQVNGSMDDQQFVFDESKQLSLNSFDLPGYTFDGWNTKIDGSGDTYANGANVKNLTTEDGGTVTLFAQWKPLTYKITFSDGLSSDGSQCPVHEQMATFDKTCTLDKYSDDDFGWTGRSNINTQVLYGWSGAGFGSFYRDGSSVYNFVEKDENGNLKFDENGNLKGRTLTAVWVDEGKIVASVIKDGEPQISSGGKIASGDFFLKKKDGDQWNDILLPAPTVSGNTFVFDPADFVIGTTPGQLPPGEYKLFFDPDANAGTQVTDEYTETEYSFVYETGDTVSAVFEYYTVSAEKDPGQTSQITSFVLADAGGTIQPASDGTLFVPDGRRLNLQTQIAPGYHFDGYSVLGITPGDKDDSDDFDPSATIQTITARGKADIMAHAAPNVYTVVFNKNGGKIVTGEMEDQDMVYDEPQHLFANRFECVGGTFTGWNTEPDGSGDSFADGMNFDSDVWESLGFPDDGAEITLFAQWDMEVYDIEYDLDGGELPGGMHNPDTYTAADPDFMLIEPEKVDHDFMGWIGTDCPVPTKEVIIEQGSIGDRNYTACWRMKSFLVTFELNGGVGETEDQVLIHHKLTKPEDPKREHFSFGGWYIDKELTTEFDFETKIEKDITLYAKWNSIPHKITYDLNGGTLDGQTGKIVVDANEGDVIKILKAPTRKGYKFKYWKGSKYYPGDSYTVEEDHTLTAVWKKDNGNKNEKHHKKRHGVDTGDDSSLPLWIILMGSAAAALAGMIYRRTRFRGRS